MKKHMAVSSKKGRRGCTATKKSGTNQSAIARTGFSRRKDRAFAKEIA
jgi:hypothetical protein